MTFRVSSYGADAERGEALVARLSALWEASVRATHDFLSESDIRMLRPQAAAALRGVARLTVVWNSKREAVAFMGTERGRLEMLFVDPCCRGAGVGRMLVQRAVVEQGVRTLTVNEQNPQARGFYERMGFEVAGRSEYDEQGAPFPILYMELKEENLHKIMERAIAKDLLSIGAVFLRPEQPFTWASGIKSPIYCDNRLTLTAPEVRKHVEAGLAEIIRTKYPDAEVLMGTSTAGIAHAAITATILDLPMGYVRSGQKDHGRGNRIEGRLEKGQRAVVIEDLISTAGSCIEVVEALRAAGAEVLGVASIFTYGMRKGLDRLAAAHVTNYSLSNLDVLVEVAAEEGYIRPEDKARLIAFRNNPSDESWITK